MNSKVKTILATAYAVNPFKGSEDGMGWNFICQIARFNRVIAITRENNRSHIEQYQAANPNPVYERITWMYFDLPKWQRFWKKKGRGAMLYYQLWQRGVVRFIKNQQIQFDIAHNLNFHNDWTPSFLWKLKKPFVWGPIGHHPLIPGQYLEPYKKSYWMKDRLTWMVKRAFWSISPALRNSIQKADHIFCMNQSVSEVLGLPEGKYNVMPSVATEDIDFANKTSTDKFTFISVGRLVPLKGFDLTILAFARFVEKLTGPEQAKAELVIVGSGPEQAFLKQLAEDQGVSALVTFIPWIERKELMHLYRQSSVFLFPSHEGAGMVVAEALSFGLPVICLDNSGPGEFIDSSCGFAVRIASRYQTTKALAARMSDLFSQPHLYEEKCRGARQRYEEKFNWDRRGEQLKQVYQHL